MSKRACARHEWAEPTVGDDDIRACDGAYFHKGKDLGVAITFLIDENYFNFFILKNNCIN